MDIFVVKGGKESNIWEKIDIVEYQMKVREVSTSVWVRLSLRKQTMRMYTTTDGDLKKPSRKDDLSDAFCDITIESGSKHV